MDLVAKGLNAKRESKYVEFKESFDPSDVGDWCEILKDLVAMANSGGGILLIGLNNSGEPSGHDVTASLEVDPATVTDKVYGFTGYQFTEFELRELEKGDAQIAAFVVDGLRIPIVFEKNGNYQRAGQKQKTAFAKGTVYFRHGAKSEPGNSEDIRRAIERQLESIRREWIDGVRKVVRAPPGSVLRVLATEVHEVDTPGATPIRIVDDPDAPAYRVIDPDKTHPFRQTEVVEEINRRLPDGVSINRHDVLSVRRIHGTDSNEAFCHHPLYASPQYSPEFVEWVVARFAEDPEFFEKARQQYYEQTYGT